MTVLHIAHPSLDERVEHGRQAREHTPLDSHTGWRPAADRPDPVALLDEQNRTREADLVPVRHGRMMASPFTFYRGAAAVMAADLKDTPTAGLDAQLCGDAHLSNFGAFASPERKLLFDLNDFDETLPGPFEYDVKRMAASFTIAARNNGFSKADTREATKASVTAYREAMAGFAQMGTMDVWYAHLDEDDIMASFRAAHAGRPEPHDTKGKKQREGQAGSREGRPRAGQGGRRPLRSRWAEGALPRQPAGTVEARRAGRRQVPDRQPAAGRRAAAGPHRGLRHRPGRDRRDDPGPVPRLPRHAPG